MKKRIVELLLALTLVAPTMGFAQETPRNFDFEILKLLYTPDQNALISPYSVRASLNMAAAGAKGQTLDEMLRAMGADSAAPDKKADETVLMQAHAAFVSDKINVLDSYQSALNAFDAECFPLGDDVMRKANNWVREKTGGMIDTIMDNPPDPLTRLALISALTLDAKWQSPFRPENDYEGVFYRANGDKSTVTYLNGTARELSYANRDGVQIAKLPYKDTTLSCYLLLPEAGGMERLLDMLCAQGLSMIGGLETQTVDLSLPKLNLTAAVTLNNALGALGINEAFSKDADFSGIDGTLELYLSEVFQKASLTVDGEGTRAAAATQSLISTKSALMRTTDMTCDRPFVLLIADTAANNVYFAACVMQP